MVKLGQTTTLDGFRSAAVVLVAVVIQCLLRLGATLAVLIVVTTGCAQVREQIVPMSVLERPVCEETAPIPVTHLSESAKRNCDHQGTVVVFPDGTELTASAVGHSQRQEHGSREYQAAYWISNYGGAGLVAVWRQCDGGRLNEPEFFGDPNLLIRYQDLTGETHETNVCERWVRNQVSPEG